MSLPPDEDEPAESTPPPPRVVEPTTPPPTAPRVEPPRVESARPAPAASVPPARPSAPPRPSASTPPPDDDEDEEDDEDDDDLRGRRTGQGRSEERKDRRPGFEGLLRDSLRKAVERGLEVGIGTLKTADHVVRNVTDEVKLPKEISNYLFSQIDETKNVLIKAVAGEVRDFLAATDLSSELQRALTALSFEVRMEIRFIPNDKGELKPKVKAKAVPRARRRRDEDEDEPT